MSVHASLNSNHPFFSNFSNWVIGHDKLFKEMIHIVDNVPYPSATSYPPHNLIKHEDGKYVLEIAVAGFEKKELGVKTENGKLYIVGSKDIKKDDKNVIHKGIASRPFKKSFHLADNVVVENASFKDGMIIIDLQQVIPEEKKPHTYVL
jgi:molecular chaperone IbpA